MMIPFPRKKRLPHILSLISILALSGSVNPIIATSHAANTINNANSPTSADVDELFSPENDKLSFYFQNIETKALLQLIAKNSGLNFIISDAVKGSITLNLKNVTWEQALNIVLKTQGLSSRRIGNVVYVSTIEEITNNEAKVLKSEEALSSLAPLKSSLIQLKYTNAADLATLLKGAQGSLLTSRGEIAVDSRTNMLIIRDTASNLSEITRAIRKMDVPARQVLIEARIVNIDTTYEEELGVRFGVSKSRHFSGTMSGANQMSDGVAPAAVDPYTDRLNFNVPANTLFDGARPGSIAVALAKIGNYMLDLELSALEGERHAQVISRPRVITSNQQKATIQTGEEIPYQEATSSGATSVVFKKAVLSLEITPQITPDNKIILKLKATQDSRGENIAVGQSSTSTPTTIPAINTQEVESNVLLKNNETIVIGGVYKTDKRNTIDRIPFFGTLPIVGPLFNHKGQRSEKHELLIFITTKIIEPSHQKPIQTALYKDGT